MSLNDVDILIEMGFNLEIVQKALDITGNRGVEPAMEWLLAHHNGEHSLGTVIKDDAIKNESIPLDNATLVKCDLCGKTFKSNLEVELHASKSGHDKFSESNDEIRELPEEEKKKKLQILEDKLRQKRKEREEKETQEQFEREKNRIQLGKEISQTRKKLEEQEMTKLIEMRKRERYEDKIARQKVKEQIEADRIARKNKNIAQMSYTTNGLEKYTTKDAFPESYNETKLQIRLTNGQVLQQNFGCKEQLSAVRLFIELNRTDDVGPFILMTNFPKKIFTTTDYDLPLEVLGLVPSAVIIVQKK